MDESRERTLRSALVLALVDGHLDESEQRFIKDLQLRLGVGPEELKALCEQVRQNPRRMVLPKDPEEGRQLLEMLRNLAAIDGQVAPREQAVLERIAAAMGLGSSGAAPAGAPADEADLAAAQRRQEQVEELYRCFAQWDDAARRSHVEAAGAGGAAALLRVLESYRAPDGAEALDLKTLVAEQLGRLGDGRAVYYLAQQVCLGDVDDEISNAALRAAAAEAIGAIVGQPFGRDAAGIAAARKWWREAGQNRYNQLAV